MERSLNTVQATIAQSKQDCPVHVGPSKRHGTGVFAARNIKQGEAICSYHQARKQTDLKDLEQDIENKPIVGSLCARYFNDSLRPDFDRLVNPLNEEIVWDACIREIQNYTRKSLAVNMVYTESQADSTLWFFAKREIRKGEEVVMHYGEHHWLQYILSTTTRVAVLLVIMCIYESDYLESENITDEWTSVILRKYKLYDSVHKVWLKIQKCEGGNVVSMKDVLVMLMQTLLKRDIHVPAPE